MNLFSEKMSTLKRSASIELAGKAKELLKKDASVIDLSWGEPDFDTPHVIKERAKEALDQGKTRYTNPMGDENLRRAIGDKLRTENGLDYGEKNIIVTPGAKQAVFYSLLAFLNRGDEVILPEPYWLSYRDMILLCEGKIVPLECCERDDFRINPESLKKAITQKTKVIILNNPTNPTGSFLSRRKLEEIADIVRKKDLIVISDEIYEKIIFDNNEFTSFASLEGTKDKTITVNGFSKAYAMTGWRLGYLASSEAHINNILKIHQHIATCASSFSQYAASYCFRDCVSFVSGMKEEYQKRRDLLCEKINRLKHFSCLKPGGTFYLFMNIKKFRKTSEETARFLLDKARIVVTPGSSYGRAGEGYVRIAFTKPIDKLEEALKRLEGIDNESDN